MNLLTELKIHYGLVAKRFPPFFDWSKRLSRLAGLSDPIYRCLCAFSRAKAVVSFLQIGSNDGISQDPLREFIVRNPRWIGCFIEPLPHLFAKLKKNYRYLGRENLCYRNAAVSDTRGGLALYRIKGEYHHEFPCFVDQIASLRKSHIEAVFPGHPQLEEKIELVQVDAISIGEVVASFPESRLDLLHLDVEGHERVILSNFPFEECLPEIILFESGHLSNQERSAIDTLLYDWRYSVFEAGFDAIALAERAPEPCREAIKPRRWFTGRGKMASKSQSPREDNESREL